jgi:hypothetical protein
MAGTPDLRHVIWSTAHKACTVDLMSNASAKVDKTQRRDGENLDRPPASADQDNAKGIDLFPLLFDIK